MALYAYLGHDGLIDALGPRLEAAGYGRTEEVAAADVVLTYYSNLSSLDDGYYGDGGLLETVNEGTLVVDLSPTTPNFAKEMNAVATISDIKMVEAPLIVEDVLAPDPFARENLRCFAGGDEGSVSYAESLLNVLFGTVQAVNSPGEAQLARAASTLKSAAALVASIEALALFKACRRSVSGMDIPDMVKEVAFPEMERLRRVLQEERFESAYTVEMLMGEISAAIMTADDCELIMPQSEAAFHLLELLAVIGGSDKSPVALALVYEGDTAQNTHGLDWSRAAALYDQAEQGAWDAEDGEEDGFDEIEGSEDDLFGEDSFGLGFGYSAN